MQILREHPLLGAITVARLVETGVVRVTPIGDPGTATSDVWLTLRSRPRAGGGQAMGNARRDATQPPIAAPEGGRRPAPVLEGSRS